MLKELCLLNGTSGDECAVKNYIVSKIKDKCEYKIDALGSIIAFKKGVKRANKKVMICAHMDEVGFLVRHISDIGFVYLIALVLVLLLAMLKGYAYTTFEDVAVSVFAGALVPFGFSVFIRLRDMFQIEQFGIYLIFYGLICALATDSGAQLAGMAFGKHKMSPNISPKKTVEGAIGGLIFSLILNAVAMILYNRLADFKMDEFAVTVLLAACLPVSFLGMMGDLSASVLKRNFGVKDFGKIFPGHGGVMDRFDSSMFTLPVTYALALTVFSK